MNFLSEVLQTAEKVQIEDLNARTVDLKTTVTTCKTDVLNFLENVYIKFMDRPKHNKMLAAKLGKLQIEAEVLKKDMEEIERKNLVETRMELFQNLASLEETNFAIKQIESLVQVHVALVGIRNLSETNSYLSSMKKIKEIEPLFQEGSHNNLQVWQELKINLITEKNSLLYKITKIVNDYVVMEVDDKCTCMKIQKGESNLEEIFTTLYVCDTNIMSLNNVSNFLLKNMFVPIVNSSVIVNVTDSDWLSSVTITTSDAKKNPSCSEVFLNMKTILNYLNSTFNYKLGENVTTLTYIGQYIQENLCELLIKHCLQDTIPSTSEGLQTYSTVIEKTKELQQLLIETGIFAPNNNKLLEYVNDVDIHFINKKCKEYLNQARNMMKKDLHDAQEVGVEEDIYSFRMTDFPKCSVSTSVLELLKLIEQILNEAATSPEVCAGRLYCTAKNIVQMYTVFVPEHHKKLLQTIPQQVALFYNNCTYILHMLSKYNEKYSKTLTFLVKLGPCVFTDEGNQLQIISSDMFTNYVDGQLKQIEEIIGGVGLQQHQTLEKVEPTLEKAVRQCLRQQELLKTVWIKVLPYSKYNKTLGVILNKLCDQLVSAVLKFEDISSDAAEQLTEVFKIIVNRGPKLFTEHREVSIYATNWHRFNEIIFILGASLLQINDRWSEGKGPVAMQIKPTELKQLVRALFQNTERRAALLSKIHD